jgi:hypothetical protein
VINVWQEPSTTSLVGGLCLVFVKVGILATVFPKKVVGDIRSMCLTSASGNRVLSCMNLLHTTVLVAQEFRVKEFVGLPDSGVEL